MKNVKERMDNCSIDLWHNNLGIGKMLLSEIGDLSMAAPQAELLNFIEQRFDKESGSDGWTPDNVKLSLVSHDGFIVKMWNIAEEFGDLSKIMPQSVMFETLLKAIRNETINQENDK